jgi:hypothetical protein
MAYREERGFKKENEDAPEGGFPAAGDQVERAPGSVSAQESHERSRIHWDPEKGGGLPGFEGTPAAAPARLPAAVYAQPPSNLRATPISVAELAAKSSSGVYRNVSRPVELKLSDKPNVESTHD